MNDMQKSELVIAKILQLLMDWGVQSCNLEFKELGLREDFLTFFSPCADWLVDEGIIRAAKIHKMMDGNAIIVNPVLTSYGMSALGTKISLGGEDMTLAEAANNVGTNDKSYSGIGDFVGGLLGGFTKSLGS